jgi:CxxC-x17-CxxC domain-containing protein
MYEQNFQDKNLQCVECSESFVFSGEDQEFYSQKGYSAPKRCPVCRANRKANSQRGGGGRGGYGGGGGRSNKAQYEVVCSACGRETTVPFEPKGDRPVYCSDCYRNNQ